MQRLIPLLISVFVLMGAMSSCEDDPVTPPGKCDTCSVDTTGTTDTTDTVVVSPNDTTSHDFVWIESSISGEASIGGCWVFDDTTIWVLGANLYRLKGSAWENIPLKNEKGLELTDGLSGANLFAFSLTNAWIVHYGGAVWRYDGTVAWEYRDDVTQGAFRAAWGTSSNDMFFVGDEGVIVHFDGTNWMKFPKVTNKHLTSISGTSSSNVWVAGWSSSTAISVLLHYDGTSWEEIDVSTIGWIGYGKHGMGSVWVVDSAGHEVLHTAGSLVWKRTDNGSWRQDSSQLHNGFGDGTFAGIGLFGNTSNDLFGAGSFGYAAHWNGRSWHRFDRFWSPSSFSGFSAGSMKGNTVCLAGTKSGSWIAIGRRTK